MRQSKESLNSILAKEGPRVSKHLEHKGLTVTAENVKAYYAKQGRKMGQNAVKQMVKHLSQSPS